MNNGLERRVVVTGVGAITNVGPDSVTTVKGLLNNVSGLSPLSFEHPDVKFGGEIHDFDPVVQLKGIVDHKTLKKSPIAAMYAFKGIDEALAEADLLGEPNKDKVRDFRPEIDRRRVGVIIGSAQAGTLDEDKDNPKRAIIQKLDPSGTYPILRILPERVASAVGIRYGLQGRIFTPVAACGSAGEAEGQGYDLLANPASSHDIVIVGGTDAAITPRNVDGFNIIKALSKTQDGDRLSMPFDIDRNGFHMAEGAGILIFEEYEHAIRRGATPLAEVVGFGSASDGAHETNTSGSGMQRAMEIALSAVQGFPKTGEVYVVSAHGTATPDGDAQEEKVLFNVFPDPRQLQIIALKGAFGHTLGASGGIASAIAARQMEGGFVPPNKHRNAMNRIGACLSNEAVQTRIDLLVVNSSGFGGLNNTVVFAPVR